MQLNLKYDLGDEVVEVATGIKGKIVTAGVDEHGDYYECEFQERIQGRRRHWKREREIKLVPKRKKKK